MTAGAGVIVRGLPLFGDWKMLPTLRRASCLLTVSVPRVKSTTSQVRPSSSEIRKPVNSATVINCSIFVSLTAASSAATC